MCIVCDCIPLGFVIFRGVIFIIDTLCWMCVFKRKSHVPLMTIKCTRHVLHLLGFVNTQHHQQEPLEQCDPKSASV